MLTLRTTSPFQLIDRLEQQLSQPLHRADHLPAAEVHETAEAYEIVLELPGVEKDSIEVRATDRGLTISAERRTRREQPQPTAAGAPEATDGSTPEASTAPATEPAAQPAARPSRPPLLSEIRYGTWTRSFRFPTPLEREQLQARYRDGLLTVTAPKAHKVTTVTVKVDS